MGSPYNLNDLLRATGGAMGRAATGVGRAAIGAGRGVLKYGVGDFGAEPEVMEPPPPQNLTPIAAHAERLSAPPPPVNFAAIRSSDMRAQAPAPAPGLEQDFDMPPTDMGTYTSPMQRAQNRGIAQRGAFDAGPEWKGVGGGPRSAAQMEQDLYAHDVIDRGYRQGVEQNNVEEAVRGNPIERQIEARKRSLAYEDLLPADSTSRIRAASGRAPLRDFWGQEASELGMPTLGEERQSRSLINQAAAKQNPKDVAEGATTMGRGRIAEELDIYRRELIGKVKAKKMTEADASAAWAKAADQARALAEIMKTGYPPVNPYPPEIPPDKP